MLRSLSSSPSCYVVTSEGFTAPPPFHQHKHTSLPLPFKLFLQLVPSPFFLNSNNRTIAQCISFSIPYKIYLKIPTPSCSFPMQITNLNFEHSVWFSLKISQLREGVPLFQSSDFFQRPSDPFSPTLRRGGARMVFYPINSCVSISLAVEKRTLDEQLVTMLKC